MRRKDPVRDTSNEQSYRFIRDVNEYETLLAKLNLREVKNMSVEVLQSLLKSLRLPIAANELPCVLEESQAINVSWAVVLQEKVDHQLKEDT